MIKYKIKYHIGGAALPKLKKLIIYNKTPVATNFMIEDLEYNLYEAKHTDSTNVDCIQGRKYDRVLWKGMPIYECLPFNKIYSNNMNYDKKKLNNELKKFFIMELQ